jgi:iron complex transport system substrate-binding protein
VVGITHECDFPPEAASRPAVTSSALPTAGASPAEIDRLVSASLHEGDPVYRLDFLALARLAPDLVVTQDLCRVCAVPTGAVDEALDRIGRPSRVVSLDPSGLDEVLESILELGRATSTEERAAALVASMRARLDAARASTVGRPRLRTLALEWSDPPFTGGHWVHEMIELAGGEPVLTEPGRPSRRCGWDEVAGAAAEVIVFMPCGYDLEAAAKEGRVALLGQPALASAPSIVAVDASAHWSRPGPRLVDGVEALAAALRGEPSESVVVIR